MTNICITLKPSTNEAHLLERMVHRGEVKDIASAKTALRTLRYTAKAPWTRTTVALPEPRHANKAGQILCARHSEPGVWHLVTIEDAIAFDYWMTPPFCPTGNHSSIVDCLQCKDGLKPAKYAMRGDGAAPLLVCQICGYENPGA